MHKKIYTKIVYILAAASFMLASCANPAQDTHTAAGDAAFGTVVVQVGGSGAHDGQSRSVLPAFNGLTFNLTFTSDAYDEPVEGSFENAPTGTFQLKPGIWNVEVTAFEAANPSAVIASGSGGPIYVNGGKTVSFGVALQPAGAETGQGILDYTVTLPPNFASVEGNTAVLQLITFPGGETVAEKNIINQDSGTIPNIPAGYYRLVAHLSTTEGTVKKTAGKSGIVHIYHSRTSTFEWTFTAQNFANERTYFISLEELKDYLVSQPMNTAASAYEVKLRVDMGSLAEPSLSDITKTDALGKLFKALYGRYVRLDLSDSWGDILDSTFPTTYTTAALGNHRLNYDRIVDLILPSTLKRIGSYAFAVSPNVNIVFPASLEEIGTGTFRNSSISRFDFSNTNLTKIGADAFNGGALSEIDFGTVLSEVGLDAFVNCAALQSVLLPKSLTAFTFGSFSGITLDINPATEGLLEFTADGLWILGRRLAAFSGSGTDITIPNNVTIIANAVFKNLDAITRIVLPSGLTSIGDEAFSGCTSLATMTLPNTVESIGTAAFYNCDALFTAATVLTLPPALKTLGARAFFSVSDSPAAGTAQKGSNFKKVDMSNTQLTSISDYAFACCENLEEVLLPDGLKTIGQYAFTRTKLAAVDLEDTEVQTIGMQAFAYINELNALTLPNTLKTLGNGAFTYSGRAPTVLEDPSIELTLPPLLTSLPATAFCGMGSLKTIMIPASIAAIGQKGLSTLTGLLSFTVESGSPFSTEDSGKLLINDNTIIAGALGAYGEGTIDFPNIAGVTKIGHYAFGESSILDALKYTGVSFANNTNITEIGQNAFMCAGDLVTLDLGVTVTSILASAFTNTGLTTVTFPASITDLGGAAFQNIGPRTDSSLTFTFLGDNRPAIGSSVTLSTLAHISQIIVPNGRLEGFYNVVQSGTWTANLISKMVEAGGS